MTITEPVSEVSAPPPSHRSRKRLVIAGAGVALVAGAAVYATGWTSLMGVTSVTVEGTTSTPKEQLIATAGIAKGTPMMRVDLRAAVARLADLPQLASVDVTRQWPRTVVVSVTERQAVAAQKSADGWELLDATGVAFAAAGQKPKDLPRLDRSPDEATNTAMLRALGGMSPEVRARVAAISAASPEAIRLVLRKGGAIVNWGSADESDYKSQVLMVLLSTDSGWYDVSNPNTPSTAQAEPQPATPASGADDEEGDEQATPAPSPSVSPTQPASPTPTTTAPATGETPVGAGTPAAAETPVGVVPD